MLKNVNKALLVSALLLILAFSLFACGGGGERTYRVMVSYGEGAEVIGENPKEVNEGESVTFKINILEGYVYKSSDGATYNMEDGTLTVKDVRKNTNIDLVTEKLNYDPNATYAYIFKGASDYDTTSIEPGPSVKAGTAIGLSARDTSRVFLGWSLNGKISAGGTVLSTSREYEFTLTPDLVRDGVLSVYANYLEVTGIIYNANGGGINKSSQNLKSNYYTASYAYDNVEITYKNEYLSYFECASSFYDDGTFTRDGYVLREYNTKPDGTGTAYSLGSKVPMTDGTLNTVLYCIWSPDTSHSDFTYEEVNIPMPEGVTAARAPHWVENGIKITSYLGNDKTVTVPERINGKTVISIGAGAFINKDVETLVLSRRLLRVEDNAFLGCDSLTTVYYPDGLYSMSDAAFDNLSYTSFKNFYVNATLAPRFMGTEGAFSVKLSRLLAPTSDKRVVIIGGSSALQGVSSEYFEALVGEGVRFINFGTTRTTHGAMYLEAMKVLAREGDVILYAPENSSYMFGETKLYYKTLRDLESMNNIYRYVDFSRYTGMFSSMTDLNQTYRYKMNAGSYEAVAYHGELTSTSPTYAASTTNKYGDYLYIERKALALGYHDSYFITLNERVKSRDEGPIYGDQQVDNKDYTDKSNITWASIDDPYFKDQMNFAISSAKSSGARVYFSFCPVDGNALVEGAETVEWQAEYDKLIDDIYVFDGRVGSVSNYIFNHVYFYDCAFHPNDYGRVFRTYQLYSDLLPILAIGEKKNLRDAGTGFAGCLFETGDKNGPILGWQG